MVSFLPPLSTIACVVALAMGVTVLVRDWRAPPHRWFAAGSVLLALESGLIAVASGIVAPETFVSWQRAVLATKAMVPGVWLGFSLCFGRGNGADFLRRWRWFVAGAILLPPALAVGLGPYLILSLRREAVDLPWTTGMGWAGSLVAACRIVLGVVILMNLEQTLRTSVGTARWRLKFMLLGVGTLFVFRTYTSAQNLVYHAVDPRFELLNSAGVIIAGALVGWSIFRTRLGSVDVYPSPRLVYRSVTLGLAAVYLVAVGAMARLVDYLGGPTALPLRAFLVLLAVIGLAVLFLSDRLRHALKRFLSRSLGRPLHDYRRIWLSFTERVGVHSQEAALGHAAVRWLAETFEALSVSLWRIEPSRRQVGLMASTSLPVSPGPTLVWSATETRDLLAAIEAETGPRDLDAMPGEVRWVTVLREANPNVFPHGGHRILAPLRAGGSVPGFLVLGDRVRGTPYVEEDLDLLACLSQQVARALLNLSLSQRVAEAKQLEAFQGMSAFLVHDLKNAAASLGLMCQNLGEHFGDPAFREDALRTVSHNVAHLKDLVRRLGQLREGLAFSPVETDLNEVVRDAVGAVGDSPSLRLQLALAELPKARLDPVQVGKLVMNLVLNAREAVGAAGEIRVATALDAGGIVVSVADTGCGMTRDFVERSLFRPFQTTKRQGMGIGMFQCKTIVDAHGGRIEVESAPGQGTTFRVWLPRNGTMA